MTWRRGWVVCFLIGSVWTSVGASPWILTTKTHDVFKEGVSFDAAQKRFRAHRDVDQIYEIPMTQVCWIQNQENQDHLTFKELPQWRLWDGEVVTGEFRQFDGKRNTLLVHHALSDQDFTFSLDKLRRVLLTTQALSHFLSMQDQKGKGENPSTDSVFLANGDSDSGSIESFNKEKVVIQSDTYKTERSYPWAKIDSLLLASTLDFNPPDSSYAVVHLTDGTLLKGSLDSLTESRLEINSFGLGKISIPLTAVFGMYFRPSDCVFLSDLEPERINEKLDPQGVDEKLSSSPDLELEPQYPYQRDQSNVRKNPLTLGEGKNRKEYGKGLGVHAYSELTYRLDGQYQKFITWMGVDQEGKELGQVQFMIKVDGKKVFESDTRHGKSPPLEKEIDVKGAKTLTLIVEEAPLFVEARADWAMARLIK